MLGCAAEKGKKKKDFISGRAGEQLGLGQAVLIEYTDQER